MRGAPIIAVYIEISIKRDNIKMTVVAWYMDDDTSSDQRNEHHKNPPEYVSREVLDSLGVLQFNGITGVDDENLNKIRKERGYTYSDLILIAPDKLPNYEEKIKSFFREHIHYDEEIRCIVDGSGYFDIRDADDRWIRIAVESGDLIILPEGIYHRFTCDSKNFIQALRFVNVFDHSLICL